MPVGNYWKWMKEVCELTYKQTVDGGSIYFMQREKNTAEVINTLTDSGWTFQNLIIWQKKTSAIPSLRRFGKSYQVIVFATKGRLPNVFNKLRIDPPLPDGYQKRANGIYVTDVWQDIRELTSGYFAGEEALRTEEHQRAHKQQSPIALLIRIILSSSLPGMTVFDPFAGSGTTCVVATQLFRHSISVEIDPNNVELIQQRIRDARVSDDVRRFRPDYLHTADLDSIWLTTPATKRDKRNHKDEGRKVAKIA